MRRYVLLLPLVILATSFGQELLVNGDFEQPLDVGWAQDTGGYGYRTVVRDTGYQPDPDFEVCDSQYSGSGWTRLSQTVDVPGPILHLSFWASFAVGGGSSTCWPVASVDVVYRDDAGTPLGTTKVYYHNEYCTWVPDPTLGLVEVTTPDWTQYSLDIADELSQHLPGVNPGDVRKITVALSDTTAGG